MKTRKPPLSGAVAILDCGTFTMSTLRALLGLLPVFICLPTATALAQAEGDLPEPDLETFVQDTVADFHERRIQRLSTLKLDKVLARKNPYLLKAKSLDTPRQLVTELLDSHLAPQEAGIFGSVMEQIYQKLLPLIGDVSARENNAFDAEYQKAIDRFTEEFSKRYADDGEILWNKIVELGSGDQ
jgi:hypothetical protein